MRIFLVLGLCGLLAGCGLMARKEREEQQAAAKTQSDAAIADCESKFPQGGKQYVERAQCINAGVAIMRPFVPFPDLLDQDMANRAAMAERLQQGKITLAEANSELAQRRSQIVAEEQRRQLSGRAVSAQESAAAAAWRAFNTTNCY